MAPRNGEKIAMTMLAAETDTPSQNVLEAGSAPALQYSLKKIGKNPAITVVENEEMAQS
jgi:hypothetical protein